MSHTYNRPPSLLQSWESPDLEKYQGVGRWGLGTTQPQLLSVAEFLLAALGARAETAARQSQGLIISARGPSEALPTPSPALGAWAP